MHTHHSPSTVFTSALLACCCRNNTSDYYVNSKKVSSKEVTSLLKGKGIDLDNNRFLILQVCVCGGGGGMRVGQVGGRRWVASGCAEHTVVLQRRPVLLLKSCSSTPLC
jgi:hypothetical protein